MTAPGWDVLVVGAGPAGSSAALAAARRGARVLFVERRRQVGLPVQCAEYIPAMLKGELGLGSGYVVQKIEGMYTFVPGQAVKETVAPGYVIRRELFDQTLVAAALAAGAELKCATQATAIHPEGNVTLSPRDGTAYIVCPKVIIGADGPLSTVGRWVDAENCHLLSGVQMTLPLALPLVHTEIYFDPEIVAGYGWLFPKGNLANVGLGMLQPTGGRPSVQKFSAREPSIQKSSVWEPSIQKSSVWEPSIQKSSVWEPSLQKPSDREPSVREVLDKLIRRLKAEGKICGAAVAHATGWIPVGPVHNAVHGKVLLVGDAAGQTHPITGAGIFAAVTCGKLAGKYAAAAVEANDMTLLKGYDREWQDLFGGTLARARHRREQMEASWSTFDTIVQQCWVAYREYYA